MATLRLYLGWEFEETPEGVTRLSKRQSKGNVVYWLLDGRTRLDRDTDGRLFFRLNDADVDALTPPSLKSLIEEVSLHDYPKGGLKLKNGRYEQDGAVARVDQSGGASTIRVRGPNTKSVIDIYWAILMGNLDPSASTES